MTSNLPDRQSIEEGLKNACRSLRLIPQTGERSGVFSFPSDFPGFTGHFADHPVLPAIVQLAVVRIVAGTELNKELIPLSVERVKFKKKVAPGEVIVVTVKPLVTSDNNMRVRFSISGESDKIATGEISFGVEER